MYVFVCLLMKGSISFDPNNAKFTQKIDKCTRSVITTLYLTKNGKEPTKKSLQICSATMKLCTKCLKYGKICS